MEADLIDNQHTIVMAQKFNVRQLTVTELVSHICSFKEPGAIYKIRDLRSLTRKDIAQQPLAELWGFLMAVDSAHYGAWGEAIPDRRRKFKDC